MTALVIALGVVAVVLLVAGIALRSVELVAAAMMLVIAIAAPLYVFSTGGVFT